MSDLEREDEFVDLGAASELTLGEYEPKEREGLTIVDFRL